MRNHRGFGLVELLVIVGIVLIVIGSIANGIINFVPWEDKRQIFIDHATTRIDRNPAMDLISIDNVSRRDSNSDGYHSVDATIKWTAGNKAGNIEVLNFECDLDGCKNQDKYTIDN